MALFDSADLLARCKQHARRPATDQAMPDAAWYTFLTEAQPEVYDDLFSRFPDLRYSAPSLMSSSDGGYTYTFGLDDAGDPIRPMGHAEIYPNLQAIPDDPLIPGVDFILEGSLIRIHGNRARSFSSGPYARLVLEPDRVISASVQPLLQPKPARMLLVIKALESWARRPGSGADQKVYLAWYDDHLTKVLTRLASAYNGQAAQPANIGYAWWRSVDFGSTVLV